MNLILHIDEITLKGNNRPFFYRVLIKNLQKSFKGIEIKRIQGGLWVKNFNKEKLSILENFPGIAVFAEAFKIGVNYEDIMKTVDKFDFSKYESFAIRTHRLNKNFEYTTQELNVKMGDYVVEKYNLKVDLTKPEFTLHIDIYQKEIIVYGNLSRSGGGLPSGSTGKVVSLLSGGIDSPVASYLCMRRGAEIVLLHFQNETHVTEEVSQKIIDLAKVLFSYQYNLKLYIFPFENYQKEIIKNIPADYRMIITRRVFNKITARFAKINNIEAMITGDSLGQVASQTLENMIVIYEANDLLKLTPLAGYNKSDIINLARKIGTLTISERPYEDCCSLFVAKHPQTRSKLDNVLEIEKKIDLSTVEALDENDFISYNIGIS